MSVELSLLNNVINNYINKKFVLDGPTSQLVSIITINCVTILYNYSQDFNINNYNIKEILNYIIDFKYIIILLICYFLFKKTNQKIYETLLNIFNKIINLVHVIIKKNKYYKLIIQYFNTEININQDNIKIININKNINKNIISYKIELSGSNTETNIEILNMYKFINLHPEMFNTNIDHRLINYNDDIFYIYNKPLEFNDIIHNVFGTIETKCSEYQFEGKAKYNISMIININKDKNDKEKYIYQIHNYINTQMKHGDKISLKYYKVLPTEMITHIFYEDNIKNWHNDIKLLKDEFFSEHKDYLFSVMESKKDYHITKSNTWNNLLLYGAPGLGKSSLIYRIATLLKKSIISIDISQYINKKKSYIHYFYLVSLNYQIQRLRLLLIVIILLF